MSEDSRIYSDEEFALILRKATDLGSRTESATSDGLTLQEMKSAAAQVGIDPDLVERAARMMAVTTKDSPFVRLMGGPLYHYHEVRFPVKLDEARAALLLSAIRISANVAGNKDSGHSSRLGLTWHDGGELESLGVTAQPDDNVTAISISIDRRGTAVATALASGMAASLVTMFSVFALYPDSAALGVGGLIVGLGGVAAAARGFWASSTRRVRDRIASVMDSAGRTLTQAEASPPERGEPPRR